jgi:RNA polymerase sigma factor (sigma-70 family)
MHDARDAEDRRLLEAGDYKQLLASYFHPVRQRCFLRLRNWDAADEATQLVFLRLLSELERGKTYPVVFRVVVWRVTEWTLNGFRPGAKQDTTLPEGWEPPAPDAHSRWEEEYDLVLLLGDLPERQRQVLTLRYGYGLPPEEIAQRLGLTRNAVDQAAHNGHRNLAKKLAELRA